jgi:hypothetical protein
MGASLCSQPSRTVSNLNSFQFTKQWYTLGGDEDEGKEIVSFNNLLKSTSMPRDFNKDCIKTSPLPRATTGRTSRIRGYSLNERMKWRHQSSVVSAEGELLVEQYSQMGAEGRQKHLSHTVRQSSVVSEGKLLADKYSKMVREDTLKRLNQTVRTADSIVQKSAHINEELGRQERVLEVDKDMPALSGMLDQTEQSLKGMTSIRGKIASAISKKISKQQSKGLCKIDIDLLSGQTGFCAFSGMTSCESLDSLTATESSEETPQDQIKISLGLLNDALDIIKVQQLERAWALARQEGRLNVLEEEIDTTRTKINRQNRLMKKIKNK